jgi:hypothetical protein
MSAHNDNLKPIEISPMLAEHIMQISNHMHTLTNLYNDLFEKMNTLNDKVSLTLSITAACNDLSKEFVREMLGSPQVKQERENSQRG